MQGRSRDIYGAWGWGTTHIHLFISIIALEKASEQL